MEEVLQSKGEIIKLEIQARRTHNELRPRIKKTVDLNFKILAKENSENHTNILLQPRKFISATTY